MFRHPYPVGYRAAKRHFGREWEMRIEKGEEGPVFVVRDGSGVSFRGDSPTKPWTDVCLKYTTTGTRVSGPLVREEAGGKEKREGRVVIVSCLCML